MSVEVVEQGATRSTVRLRNGLQVDLRVVPEASYGAALCYFTGSKAHNIALRQIAIDHGLKLNEYGLFKGTRRLAGRTEEELYQRLGLPFLQPSCAKTRVRSTLHEVANWQVLLPLTIYVATSTSTPLRLMAEQANATWSRQHGRGTIAISRSPITAAASPWRTASTRRGSPGKSMKSIN